MWNTGFRYYSSVDLSGMGTMPCFADERYVFFVVSCVRSSRAAISDFLGCFFGRYFILSMFECHVRFERIFDKISEHVKTAKSVNIAVPELAVTSLPGLLACRPWQAASGFVWELHHSDRWEPSSTRQGTRTSPCFSATILVNFRGFSQRKSYCLVFFSQKCERGFSTSSRAKVFSRLKLVWAFSLKTLLRPRSAKISFFNAT